MNRLLKRTFVAGQFLFFITTCCTSLKPATGCMQEKSVLDGLRLPSANADETLPELVALLGDDNGRHGDAAKCIAVSHDGKLVASGSRDQTVRLWDPKTLSELASFSHGDDVDAVCFSTDAKRVLSICWDGYLRIWNISQINGTASADVPEQMVRLGIGQPTGAFSSDRRKMVWSSRATTGLEMRVVELSANGRPGLSRSLQSMDWFQNSSAFAFSNDNRLLAATESTAGDEILLWDLSSPSDKPIWKVTGFDGRVEAVAFSPSSKTLLAGTSEGKTYVWALSQEMPKLIDELTDHSRPISAMGFSPDGRLLLTGSFDYTISTCPWPLDPKQKPHKLKRHTDWIGDFAFSPDGTSLYSAGWDHSVVLWNKKAGSYEATERIGHDQSVQSIAFSPDGSRIATGSTCDIGSNVSNVVLLWRIDGATPTLEQTLPGYIGYINDLAFSHDGKILAAGDGQGIRCFNLETNAFAPRQEYVTQEPRDDPFSSPVHSLQFAPKEQVLFSGWFLPILRRNEFSQQVLEPPLQQKGMYHGIVSVSTSSTQETQLMAASTNGATIYEFDATTLQSIRSFGVTGAKRIESLATSKDGGLLAVGTRLQSVSLIPTADTGSQRVLSGHTSVVASVAFGQSGRILASGDWDGNLIVWDVATGRKLLQRKFERVWQLEFAPDGQHLAIGDGSGLVKILRLDAVRLDAAGA